MSGTWSGSGRVLPGPIEKEIEKRRSDEICFICAKQLPEGLGDEILHFNVKNSVDFWWQIFFHIFPRKNGLIFVTPQNVRKFHHILHGKERIFFPWNLLWGRFHAMLGEGPPAEPRHEVFSLRFLQFCCAGPWEFRAEVFAEVLLL